MAEFPSCRVYFTHIFWGLKPSFFHGFWGSKVVSTYGELVSPLNSWGNVGVSP